jgi:hypothetical protein
VHRPTYRALSRTDQQQRTNGRSRLGAACLGHWPLEIHSEWHTAHYECEYLDWSLTVSTIGHCIADVPNEQNSCDQSRDLRDLEDFAETPTR